MKSDAAKELRPAIEAVLHGTRFLSKSVANRDSVENKRTTVRPIRGNIGVLPAKAATNRRHEFALYEDDASLVDGFACFMKSALQVGNSAIVVATELHRASVFRKLTADGIDLCAAMEQGRYVALDVGEALSGFMINNMPDTLRLSEIVDDLIRRSLAAATGERPRVAACGDCAPTLFAERHLDAAIQLEHLWDEITRRYEIDILCGYLRKHSLSEKKNPALKKICAEHSAVYGF